MDWLTPPIQILAGGALVLVGLYLVEDELRAARRDRSDAAWWLAFDLVSYGHPFALVGVALIVAGGFWVYVVLVGPP